MEGSLASLKVSHLRRFLAAEPFQLPPHCTAEGPFLLKCVLRRRGSRGVWERWKPLHQCPRRLAHRSHQARRTQTPARQSQQNRRIPLRRDSWCFAATSKAAAPLSAPHRTGFKSYLDSLRSCRARSQRTERWLHSAFPKPLTSYGHFQRLKMFANAGNLGVTEEIAPQSEYDIMLRPDTNNPKCVPWRPPPHGTVESGVMFSSMSETPRF